MALNKICLENFTVFEKMEVEFCEGINVFIGDNGTGKTHIMKLLYAACQSAHASKKVITFPQKIVQLFRPDKSNISRLLSRKAGNASAKVAVTSGKNTLKTNFNLKTKKWDAEVIGVRSWEKHLSNLTSTFIPAKEILSNSKNLINAVNAGNVDFDDTYLDIITSANVDISHGAGTTKRKKYLERIQKITNGKVTIKDEKFYLRPGNHAMLEFPLVAEGMRKIALLWQLIKNGTLEKGSVLFWDEPEANINPRNIPAIVELLLDLHEDGVQIFVATHDYFFVKYMDIKKRENSDIMFHALYKADDDGDQIYHETATDFVLLKNNLIIAEQFNLYQKEIMEVLG